MNVFNIIFVKYWLNGFQIQAISYFFRCHMTAILIQAPLLCLSVFFQFKVISSFTCNLHTSIQLEEPVRQVTQRKWGKKLVYDLDAQYAQ